MHFIAHRRNTVDLLISTPTQYGVEVDIRSNDQHLIIHHDPMCGGEIFADWLQAYRHGTLILNVKEEGLEEDLLTLMSAHGIEDFFFLDQSFPFLIKWAQRIEGRCAVRISEYESIETALSLAGKVNWVWVDCFSTLPIDSTQAQQLKDAGFRLCMVSPELQGRDAQIEIARFHRLINKRNIIPTAVCTKHPEMWDTLLNK